MRRRGGAGKPAARTAYGFRSLDNQRGHVRSAATQRNRPGHRPLRSFPAQDRNRVWSPRKGV